MVTVASDVTVPSALSVMSMSPVATVAATTGVVSGERGATWRLLRLLGRRPRVVPIAGAGGDDEQQQDQDGTPLSAHDLCRRRRNIQGQRAMKIRRGAIVHVPPFQFSSPPRPRKIKRLRFLKASRPLQLLPDRPQTYGNPAKPHITRLFPHHDKEFMCGTRGVVRCGLRRTNTEAGHRERRRHPHNDVA